MLPTTNDKVWMLTDKNGIHKSGFDVIENKNSQPRFTRGHEISPNLLEKYNGDHALVPRLYSDFESDDGSKRLTSHDYVVNFLGESKNIEDYYGFSLNSTGSKIVKLTWISATLNSRDESGRRKLDSSGSPLITPGAKMDGGVQDLVKKGFVTRGYHTES